jgi:hypothetical protein
MKLKLLMLVSVFAMGFAMSATAGNVTDTDGDGVPDLFDNCGVPNGPDLPVNPPGPGCNAQQNFDGDAYGDSCDADYNNDNFVNGSDFTPFFAAFMINATIVGDEDSNCDGFVNGSDFTPFFAQFTKNSPGLP